MKKIILVILIMISWSPSTYTADADLPSPEWIYTRTNNSLCRYQQRNIEDLHFNPKRNGPSNENILHYFAILGGYFDDKKNREAIKQYVRAGVGINDQDNLRLYTPLHRAIEHYDPLEYGLFTPQQQRLQLVALLLQYGADVSLKDIDGQTSLGLFITKANNYLLPYLAAHQSTGIIRAEGLAVVRIDGLLRASYNDRCKRPRYYSNPLLKAWVSGCVVRQQEASYPPWVTREQGNYGKKLRRMFNNPKKIDDEGCSIIHRVALINDCDAHLVSKEDITTLVKWGADINSQSTPTLETPLHVAAVSNCMSIIYMLLKNGADPLRKNRDGKTPLDLPKPSQIEVRLLLEYYSKKAAATTPVKPSTFLQDLFKRKYLLNEITPTRVIPKSPLDCLRSELSKSPAS
jgi:ankyrin repeat protein